MTEIDDAMIEAGAQALADDIWHPAMPISVLSRHEANKLRRQARIVLEAALKTAEGMK